MDSRHLFRWYRVEAKLVTPLMAGIPADPKIAEAWLRNSLKEHLQTGTILEEELVELLQRTLVETGVVKAAHYEGGKFLNDDGEEIPKEVIAQHIDAATKRSNRGLCIFKRNSVGLYIEPRQVKACLRETLSVRQIFINRRGTKNVFQHVTHVEPGHIHLFRDGKPVATPDEVLERPITVQGPAGRATSIRRAELINPPAAFGFWLKTDEDSTGKVALDDKLLRDTLAAAQGGGLGSSRSQDQGKFDVTKFDRLEEPPSLEELHAILPVAV